MESFESLIESLLVTLLLDTNLIVGCVAPSGEPECEMEGPKQENPLYKNAPSRGSGCLNQQWSRLERGGSEPRSAGSDRSERPYLTALLQDNKEGESQVYASI